MDAREQRGAVIAATTQLVEGEDGWEVPSQTDPLTSYQVAPNPIRVIGGMLCECPDFAERYAPCKHIYAVQYTVERETTTETADGATVTTTETASVRVTYGQDWAKYNKGQCAEGEMFPTLLRNLCSTVTDPVQRTGRPRLPRADMIFTAVSRVYADKSARRHTSAVRAAKRDGLTDSDPSYSSALRYLRDPDLTPVLYGLVELSALPTRELEQDFAADATGFTTCQHERWYDHKWGKERSRNKWMKLHAMSGVVTNVITAAIVTDGHGGDSPQFRPLLASTAGNFTIREVSADKAYASKSNLSAVDEIGAVPYIPPRRAVIPALQLPMPRLAETMHTYYRMQHLFAYNRDTFLAQYHKRSNVECTFSMIKRTLSGRLRSKSTTGQTNEILCKVIAHNLRVLIACVHEMGLTLPEFREAQALVG